MEPIKHLLDQPIPEEERVKLIKRLAPTIPEIQKGKDKLAKREMFRIIKQLKKTKKEAKHEKYLKKISAQSMPKVRNTRNTTINVHGAFGDNIVRITYTNTNNTDTVFIKDVEKDMAKRLTIAKQSFGVVKIQFSCIINLHRSADVNEKTEWYHKSNSLNISNNKQIKELITKQINLCMNKSEEAALEGSDWVVSGFKQISVLLIKIRI